MIDPEVLGVGGKETLEAMRALEVEHRFNVDVLLVISPHWMSKGSFLVQGSPHPKFIEDFSGFPAGMYGHVYAPPGDPALAEILREEGVRAGLPVRVTNEWGLDHGAWTALRPLAPSARIPVLALSISDGSPRDHVAWGQVVGRAVARSGKRAVAVATGVIVHNFRKIMDPSAHPWKEGIAIEGEILDRMLRGEWAEVADFDGKKWAEVQPEGDLAPYFVLVGALGPGFRPRLVHNERAFGSIGMSIVSFDPIPADPFPPKGPKTPVSSG
jgi:4,5-DOPA dioxygenase extradiol